MENASFEDDRFVSYDSFDDALAAYEAEATVRLLFESGAGEMQPGTPVFRFETQFDSWPPNEAQPILWHVGSEGRLQSEAPTASGTNIWAFDPEAGTKLFFGPDGYELSKPLWDIDWTTFESGKALAYETPPFESPTVIAGPGIAELWINSPVDDVTVQVTLTEVRPDDKETLVQSGWLRLGHRQATRQQALD